MSDLVLSHDYNGFLVSQRSSDGYWNLNQMANAVGKRIENWLRLDSTKEFLTEFDEQQLLECSSDPSIDCSGLSNRPKALITSKGGKGGGGSTWGHPDIAILFAMWCSPPFALQVGRWVREWMTSGTNPINSVSDRVLIAQSKVAIAQSKVEIERIKTDRMIALIELNHKNAMELKAFSQSAPKSAKKRITAAATEDAADILDQFINQCLVQCDRAVELSQDALIDAYKAFCAANCYQKMGLNTLISRLKNKLAGNRIDRKPVYDPVLKKTSQVPSKWVGLRLV